jgi:hypothetical protein
VRRVMRHWHAEAAPILGALVRAEDRVLRATNRVAVLLCCGQLDAAVWQSDKWLHDNPCPDRRFDRICNELIRACVAIQAILLSNLLVDAAHQAKADEMLTDRLTVAGRARVDLHHLVDR